MLKVPPETQTGKRFRLRGLGMPRLKDSKKKGDLYADAKVIVPQRLSKQEKELFTRLASLRSH
jgi:curved DNA-binding protein